ncbi:acyl carrier protein [Phytohabitans rumicis]|uniref:Carrier domain-containing protein n=1 Tax=Phytohabitans rumicis TaxID=1076125 RepID=A0A6V8L9C3_9ACTN|nr:acyl carrier protein [Phytohabitans rumicis]GFJ91598.1 hypothetical protein Prum_052400 [Phytohabitans rumicis]
MMVEEIERSVIEILREMHYEVGEGASEMSLGPDGLELDSLAVAELAVRMEDSHGVKLPDDELEKFAALTLHELAVEVHRMTQLVSTAGESE